MALVGYEWIILLVVLLLIIYIVRKIARRNPKPQPAPIQPPTTIIKEREIIREVVMVPCKYCGGLMPQASIFCPKCGAGQK